MKLFTGLFISLLSTSSFAGYLQFTDIDTSLLPEAPPYLSVEDASDLNKTIQQMKTRTKEDCDRAAKEVSLDYYSMVTPEISKQLQLTQEQSKSLRQLVYIVYSESDSFVGELKTKWNRQRPYVRSATAESLRCIEGHYAPSYPSGHATMSRAVARILGDLFPKHQWLFIERANEIGKGRIIGGLHHVNDIEAGKMLGDLVYAALKKNPDFQKYFETVKLGIQGVHLKTVPRNLKMPY